MRSLLVPPSPLKSPEYVKLLLPAVIPSEKNDRVVAPNFSHSRRYDPVRNARWPGEPEAGEISGGDFLNAGAS